MADPGRAAREGRLAIKFAGVSLIGFATDALLLHAGVSLGLAPAWARVVSLFCAMQVTFVINGLHVFRCLSWRRLPRQWAGYMASGGFGNVCNYWIFVTLVSTHWTALSNHLFALAVGSFVAWVINFTGARLLAFREPADALAILQSVTEASACDNRITRVKRKTSATVIMSDIRRYFS